MRDPALCCRRGGYGLVQAHAIAGAFYRWIVEHRFGDDALIRGELTVGGARVDPRRISRPLNLLAGEADHSTPPPQVVALAGAVSTPPQHIT